MESDQAAFILGIPGGLDVSAWTPARPEKRAEWTIKVVKVSGPMVGVHLRWFLRIVRCRADQAGHLREEGVEVLKESGWFYKSKGTLRSYEGRTRKEYEELAEKWRIREQLGLAHDTPDAVVRDYVIENGLTNKTF